MSNKIIFNLDSSLFIKNESTFEEIVRDLQLFTSSHLYIEYGKMKSVDNVTQLDYGYCQLLGVETGYILQEVYHPQRILQTFSRTLMEYLTNHEYSVLISGDLVVKNEESSWDESSEVIIDEKLAVIEEQSVSSIPSISSIPSFPEHIEFSEFQGCNDDFEFNKNELNAIEKRKENEATYENQIDESKLQERFNNLSYSPLANTSDESLESEESEESSDFSSDKFEEVEEVEESQDTENRDKFHESEKVYFRLFLKSIDDDEGIDSVYVNKKMINSIENISEIDLEETIKISFSKFLENQGFIDSKIQLEYFENVFAEIRIETLFPLSVSVINRIEDEAHLEVGNDLIYFLLRSVETYVEVSNNISDRLNGIESEYVNGEDFYCSEVELSNLPGELIFMIMDKLIYVPCHEDAVGFFYNTHEFCLKNEGDGFYSVFDCELILPVPHLDPYFYPKASSYAELPIAQFMY